MASARFLLPVNQLGRDERLGDELRPLRHLDIDFPKLSAQVEYVGRDADLTLDLNRLHKVDRDILDDEVAFFM